MWREIKKLAEKKPVVACMGDVAASGGYYMAMAAQVCKQGGAWVDGVCGGCDSMGDAA
jgi:protease-4